MSQQDDPVTLRDQQHNPYEAPPLLGQTDVVEKNATVGQIVAGVFFGLIAAVVSFFSTCFGSGYIVAFVAPDDTLVMVFLLATMIGGIVAIYVFHRVFSQFTAPPQARATNIKDYEADPGAGREKSS
jgi:hypothetical protein